VLPLTKEIMMDKLTTNEYKVLQLLQGDVEARDNEYGCIMTSEIVDTLLSEGYTKNQIAGYISSLTDKDYCYPIEGTNKTSYWIIDLDACKEMNINIEVA
jgi:hypothetical protein